MANKFKLEKSLTEKVAYAIRKHSIFNILPRETTEAQLLFDLDDLDTLNVDRLKEIFRDIRIGIDTKTRIIANYISLRSRRGFYFEWSRAIFEKRKNKFLNDLFKFRDEAIELLKSGR